MPLCLQLAVAAPSLLLPVCTPFRWQSVLALLAAHGFIARHPLPPPLALTCAASAASFLAASVGPPCCGPVSPAAAEKTWSADSMAATVMTSSRHLRVLCVCREGGADGSTSGRQAGTDAVLLPHLSNGWVTAVCASIHQLWSCVQADGCVHHQVLVKLWACYTSLCLASRGRET